MSFRSGLTPLETLGSLDDIQERALREHGIGSVEELVGAMQANLESVGSLLHISPDQTGKLRREALAHLSTEARETYTEPVTSHYHLGAMRPED